MTEHLEVEVERILPGGMGLAHAGGKTVFVSLAAPGDRVRVAVERRQGDVLFASIVEIITPSPVRVEPPCPYFGRCGGCDFQQLTYEAQLAAKAEMIRDCLHRIARLENVPEFVVTGSPNNWRYRMRATWQIDQDERTIGYYERGSRRVCDVVDCAVLKPELQEKLEEVRATEWSQFPPELKHLDVVAGENGVSFAPAFAEFETKELALTVRGEVYSYNAESFFQINPSLLEQLIDFALRDASGETVLDLYCGVGLFTLPLARGFKNVIGVEANPAAARFARRNLQRAGLTNARVITATVTDWFRSSKPGSVDFVLLDPPRAGAESAVIKGILDAGPREISYVSCDPATLARDLRKLLTGGYAIASIAAFDLFPQTHHVETIVRFRKS
ncbi:MAG TPA: class I SAM-dependent RNA methyltransferase [Pyrinomonadaceae bacterium]|nr:class I SAM-dependent RNA methyltransferase [Pyrinomonadaceae bacterium]